MNYGSRHNKGIRFRFWSLVLSFLLIACTENKKENNAITIQWNGEKAEAVIIPTSLLPGIAEDSFADQLKIRLNGSAVPVIHDELNLKNEAIIFKPLIPFTAGLNYDVLFSNKLVGQFEIPPVSTGNRSEVVAVYPTADTLPENVLKLYIVFSKPMQEGQALNNIIVIRNGHDTLMSTFLDLDNELWNRERTTLTLWFDPGRIKRDLQPNKNLGAPLQQNNRYKIIVGGNWRDERGLILTSPYQKDFVVGRRDTVSPNPDIWTIHPPKASTKEILSIDLHGPLDYLLLKNAVWVTDKNGNTINGSFEPASKETILVFTPNAMWMPGEYIIRVESRLEDLAGNNLNRLFDRDLSRPDKNPQETVVTKKFRID